MKKIILVQILLCLLLGANTDVAPQNINTATKSPSFYSITDAKAQELAKNIADTIKQMIVANGPLASTKFQDKFVFKAVR